MRRHLAGEIIYIGKTSGFRYIQHMGRLLFLSVLFCFSLVKAGTAPTNALVLTNGSTNNYVSEISSGITMAKDAANFVFFLVAGTIAILSYLQAKKTLFAPIRTETFKLQLKAFEDVLLFFEKHSSMHIDGEFDFENIVKLNSLKMLDAYMLTFFEDKIKKDAFTRHQEETYRDLVGSVISQKYFEKNFELMSDHLQSSPKIPETPSNPALILEKWQAYEHGMIEFTKKYQQTSDRLHRFQVSPLLPKELKTLITAFEDEVRKNLRSVGEVLTSIAKQLPEKYPTIDTLKKSELQWIWNEYNDKYQRLEGKQNEILQYLEGYLQTDNLLSKKS
jgi:hypothetical protein